MKFNEFPHLVDGLDWLSAPKVILNYLVTLWKIQSKIHQAK